MPESSIPMTSLAQGFPAATREAWSGLVEEALKGAGLDSLVTRGPDGLAIQPLYERWRDGPTRRPRPADAPAWDIRTRVAAADPLRANADLLEDLAGGATSALLVIARPGQPGIAAGSAASMARLLDGIMVDVAPLALDAGFLGPMTADWLADAAKSAPAAELAFHFDPLSAFAAAGASPGAIEVHLALAASRAAPLISTYPKSSLFLASGMVAHEAGASPAAELAFAAAAAVAYVEALAQAGLSAPDALKTLVLVVAVDDDILVSIAKLRAARVVWDKIAAVYEGSTPARIEARAGSRGLTRAEPWTNLIRLTVAAFAAAVGGADAIVLPTFTDPLGLPTPLARRMARNTQLILMDEARLGAVSDPLAGAGAVEALTDELARAAWRGLRDIEAMGGLAEALRAGLIDGWARGGREALRRALAEKRLRILGVTDFRDTDPVAVEAAPPSPTTAADSPDPRLPGADSRCPRLSPVNLEDLAA